MDRKFMFRTLRPTPSSQVLQRGPRSRLSVRIPRPLDRRRDLRIGVYQHITPHTLAAHCELCWKLGPINNYCEIQNLGD